MTRAGSGQGTITSQPEGIECGETCSITVEPGALVVLSAAAGDGAGFAGWSGICTGIGTCSVVVDQTMSVTAAFEPVQSLQEKGVVFGDHLGEVAGYARFRSFSDPDGNTVQLIEYVHR